MALSITEIREKVNLKLADESDITAQEHREIENDILDLLQTMLPLASGTYGIGDVVGNDNIRTVTIPDIGTDNYQVLGMLVSHSPDYNIDNDVIVMVREKTRTSFKIALKEVGPNVQNLSFDWEIKAKNY